MKNTSDTHSFRDLVGNLKDDELVAQRKEEREKRELAGMLKRYVE